MEKKTNADKLIELFPNFDFERFGINTVPGLCPEIFGEDITCDMYANCNDCQMQFWMSEYKGGGHASEIPADKPEVKEYKVYDIYDGTHCIGYADTLGEVYSLARERIKDTDGECLIAYAAVRYDGKRYHFDFEKKTILANVPDGV